MWEGQENPWSNKLARREGRVETRTDKLDTELNEWTTKSWTRIPSFLILKNFQIQPIEIERFSVYWNFSSHFPV